MNKDDVLKAFEVLSAEDQQAVRAEIARRAAASCCQRRRDAEAPGGNDEDDAVLGVAR